MGNRTSSHLSATYGYQSGQFNRLSSTATAEYGYDPNGNMVSRSEGSQFLRFGWDYENRMTMAATRKQTARYRYDALGRRTHRYVAGNWEKSTKFTYDGDDVILDDDNGTLTKYQNGLGIDNKLRSQTGSSVSYFLSDHLGSTNGLADPTGAVSSQASYDAFGNQTGNLSTRYGFTGRERDDFTGLMHYRARFYDPKLGRFISEDPIGFSGGDVNLYGYVRNNPQNFVDPSGNIPLVLTGRYTRFSMAEVQLYLGIGGMVPGIGEFCDLADGGLSLAQGDYEGAALSGSSMIPFAGWGAGITKITKRINDLPLGGLDNIDDIPVKIHGNSLDSPRPTWGYKLFQNDNKFLKNGITSNQVPETRYTQEYMADKYMKTDPFPFPNRREAAVWERTENLTNPGPLNFERYIKRNNDCGCK